MTARPPEPTGPAGVDPVHVDVAIRTLGRPNSMVAQFDFWNDRYESRRLFSELLGTFFLVLVAVGGPMVNARFGGHVIAGSALAVAPGLMVAAIILFMGAVSGAHLNPAVSLGFALRGNFPWRRVPAYVVAQAVGACAATLLLWSFVGRQGAAGLTLPGHGVSDGAALVCEIVLTVGLVSTILGTASGAQAIGSLAAIGVGSYIVLAGLWAAPFSGASMNPARSLGPALVLWNFTAWWVYLVRPARRLGHRAGGHRPSAARIRRRRRARNCRGAGDAGVDVATGADRRTRRRAVGPCHRLPPAPAVRR